MWQAVEKRLRRSRIFVAGVGKNKREERHRIENSLYAAPSGADRLFRLSLP